MNRATIVWAVRVAVFLLLGWAAWAGLAPARVGVVAEVEPFAEWGPAWGGLETIPSADLRGLVLRQRVALFANTEVRLQVRLADPQIDQIPGSSAGLAGDIQAELCQSGGDRSYRLRHVPGKGCYLVMLELAMALPPGASAESAAGLAWSGAPAGAGQLIATFQAAGTIPPDPDEQHWEQTLIVTASW